MMMESRVIVIFLKNVIFVYIYDVYIGLLGQLCFVQYTTLMPVDSFPVGETGVNKYTVSFFCSLLP